MVRHGGTKAPSGTHPETTSAPQGADLAPGFAGGEKEGKIMAATAVLYRMVIEDHLSPFGLKSKDLLEQKGFEVEDVDSPRFTMMLAIVGRETSSAKAHAAA